MTRRNQFLTSLLFAFALLAPTVFTLAAERVHTTNETLLARIQVEDFINDYYWGLANVGESEGEDDITEFWAEGAVFDVNGNVYNGLAEIEAVYALGLGPGGRLVFQPSVPKIRINGNRAVVDLIYTGMLNVGPNLAPRPHEQGHDHMELVYSDGLWKISSRTLRTFSLSQTAE